MDQFRSASGGVGAAAGLGYQYLAALEDTLDRMRDHPDEDLALESEGHVSEIVDYSIFDQNGDRALSVQAKSSVDGPAGEPLGGPEIARVFLRLIAHDARKYVLRTNRPLSKTGESLAQLLSSPGTSSIQQILGSYCTPNEIEGTTGLDFSRLERCRVISEAVGLDELRSRIADKARYLRRLRGDGAGKQSAQILVGHLVSQVLFLSSRRMGRRIDRAGLERLLGASSAGLAGAAGIVDWGIPLGPVPTARAVDRSEALEKILAAFTGPPLDGTRRVALTGLSGIGKSTLARLYLEDARHYYDRILWIDAHSTESIREAAAICLGTATENIPTSVVAEQFKTTISSAPATWLVIFDNAPDDRTIAPWLPVTGSVDLIATSTDSTGWSQWHRESILPLHESEALALVGERLGLREIEPAVKDHALRLCDALECWPLAIELACAFLSGSGGGLAMTDVYLDRLKEQIIDDGALVPPQYQSHPTLLQAILVALESISTEPRPTGLPAMALLQTLAYLPPRSTPLRLAGKVTAIAESRNSGYRMTAQGEEERNSVLDYEIDRAVLHLSSASLTHRATVAGSPWGDVLRTNEIVLDVVRRHHDEASRRATLVLLQLALGLNVKSTVDDYLFDGVEQLTACAMTTIRFSEEHKAYSLEGIALIGNLANLFAARDDPESATNLFRQELATIDCLGIKAPIIRAKIHTGISAELYKSNAPEAEIRASIDQAIYYLGHCAGDPDERAAVLDSAISLYEVIKLLAAPSIDAEDGRSAFLLRYYPELEDSLVFFQFQSQLKDPDNDDAGTLAAIEEHLETENRPGARLQFLFLRADAMALLGRYKESIKAFEEAIGQSNARDIGLAAGWSQVLNAWQTAAYQELTVPVHEAPSFLCHRLEKLTRGQQPAQEEDRTTLELCRIATRVRDTSDLHGIGNRLERLAASPFTSTHQKKHVGVLHQTLEACREVMRIRNAHHGARIVPVHSYGVRNTQPSFVAFALAQEHLDQIALPAFSTGEWVIDKQGTGLLIHGTTPVLLWLARLDTGWATTEYSSPHPAGTRIRELATTKFARPGAAVLIGSPYDGPERTMVDPGKPIFDVRLQ
jgi:tetratricopeptide (TPR) repeat protein